MSNRTYSLKSNYVLTGISKADMYCEALKQAKEAALSQGFHT